MKLKMILTVLAIALVGFIIFGLVNANTLKKINITKSVTIKNELNEVFDMVRLLENFPKWSPFLEVDPTQKYKVKGADGVVGAQYHWEGNGGKDLGYQEIVKIEEGRFIGMMCNIQKPFKAKPTFDYTFSQTPNGVLVTQDFNLESSLGDAFFMWLFGAKKGMEKMNQRGLDLLKKASEE
ncbi:MAG: SRPBCC family protein [Bacteroidota bacterium]